MRLRVCSALIILSIGCGNGGGGSGGTGGIILPDGGRDGAGGTGGTAGLLCMPESLTGGGCTGTNSKCTPTFPATGNPTFSCQMPRGSSTQGQQCSRPTSTPGIDTCATGHFCTAFGIDNDRECQRICTALGDCPSERSCNGWIFAYNLGLCRRNCQMFDSPMPPCPPRLIETSSPQVCTWWPRIDRMSSAAMCMEGGNVAIGGTCDDAGGLRCAQGGICLGDSLCHRLCDSTHGCPTGESCVPAAFRFSDTEVIVAPGPNGGGWCFPMPDGGTGALQYAKVVGSDRSNEVGTTEGRSIR